MEALEDLSRLYAFLVTKSPGAATNAIAAIRHGVLELERFPAAGRLTPTGGPRQREWLISYSNSGYVVRYEIDGDTVIVAAVRHMRENRF
jgi:plasmid stabilization system protein ParE